MRRPWSPAPIPTRPRPIGRPDLRLHRLAGGRAGASSGFRAPTATEIGANFTTTPIGTTIFGNPGLGPETSQQWEVGATATWKGGRFDTVVFQNTISNRIVPLTVSSTGGRVVQVQTNSPANLVVQGIEFQMQADLFQSFNWRPAVEGLFWNVRQRLLQLADDRLWREPVGGHRRRLAHQ